MPADENELPTDAEVAGAQTDLNSEIREYFAAYEKAYAAHDIDAVLAFYTQDAAIITNSTGRFTSFSGLAGVKEFYEVLWKQGYNNFTVIEGSHGYAVVAGSFRIYGVGNPPAADISGKFWKISLKINGSWHTDMMRATFPHRG
ncbi:hypothetical protein AAVH_29567 [Aphelenchoides avenae]|nr:hypothetical protein AAVH_29567 [Aphelenchus avenae]